ncbi:hypothetical protein FPV67DRAFT_1406118 [Lyophyllum atratum]|nr:hypothetical protein FPV67DRAFT_1406118 [Lyophyllum atratum]
MPSTTEPRVRAPNPLPEPPRDVYATSPFKHLLTPKELPTTASHNQTAFIKREIITETKPPKKGLFRAFSSKKPALQRSKTIEYVYAPTLSHNSTTSKRSSVMTAIHPPASAPAAAPSMSRAQAAPQPMIDSDASPDQPIYFDQDSEYSYYLIHSPHPVFHEGQEYPTAAHLLEALKFLPDHPEIAERIRQCDDTEEVYQLSAEYAQHENPDYAPSIVDTMQKVISLKFKQHADLRYKLWNTDPAPLRYNDPSDSFWGIGPTGRGRNELGAVLERVRAEVKPRRR